MHNERHDLSLPQAGRHRRYLDEIDTVGRWQDFPIVLVDDTTLDETVLEQCIKRPEGGSEDAYEYTPLEHGPIYHGCSCRACASYRRHGLRHPEI